MPSSRPPNGPTEDLTGVMDRFHTWTETQPPRPAAKLPFEGVREVTYTEALAAQRLRRLRPGIPQHISQDVALDTTHDLASLLAPRKSSSASTTASATPPALASSIISKTVMPPIAEAPAVNVTMRKKKPAAAGENATVAALNVKAKSSASMIVSHPLTSKAALVRQRGAKSASPARVARTSAPGNKKAAPRSTSLNSAQESASKVTAAAAKASQADFKIEFMKSLKKTARQSDSSARYGKGSFQAIPIPDAKVSKVKAVGASAVKAKTQTKGATSAKTTETKSASPLRSISINLRLSNAEHSQLRTRAAVANQAMASYIRDRVLGVSLHTSEQLSKSYSSEQVLQTDTISTATNQSVSTPPRSLGEIAADFLERTRIFWFGRRLEVTA